MGTSSTPFHYNLSSFSKLLLLWTLCLLFPLTIIHLYLYPIPILLLTPSDNDNLHSDIHILNISPPPSQEFDNLNASIFSCDYTNGKWVHDKNGPLYNTTTCDTIKEGQNCMTHGRPDKDYLFWKWNPKNCKLRRFDPLVFLKLFKDKQLAFVGDSIARNQFESLLCMLSTASPNYPQLLYSNGEENKFRKFHFGSHNFNLSIYWSPFLVKGIEKSEEIYYNTLHLESVDEKWHGEISQYDTIVLSIGHWYLLPAVYYYQDSLLGCHFCHDIKNCTEIGFYDVYGKAFRTTLNAIIERHQERRKLDVIVTTFSPAHFEGDWDKFGACSRTKPYNPNEKKLEGMDAEMREYEMKEIEEAKRRAKNNDRIKIEVVDVTKLSLLRPDGHPGPYMNPFPFQNGVSEHVQNDCVHWCMPGAIDTWNEILLEILRKLNGL